jgi:hypothetical protein
VLCCCSGAGDHGPESLGRVLTGWNDCCVVLLFWTCSDRLERLLCCAAVLAQEITVLNHLDVFRRNGFDFAIDTSASAGTQLRLAAVPVSHKTTFGVAEVQELVRRIPASIFETK